MNYTATYEWVYANVPGYGAGHGSVAVPIAAEWLRNGGTLLDIGCGRQQFNAALRPLAPKARLIGVDVVRVDEPPPGVEFIQSSAWNLTLCPRADVIASFDVLEHLAESDVEWTLAAWAEHLNRGGHVVATICTRASYTLGPEGENLHPTVKPDAWWVSQLSAFFGVRRQGELYLCERH